MLILLTKPEVAEIKLISKKRIINNIGCGANYTPYFDDFSLPTRYEHEFESFGAEFAYCRMVGVEPDLNPSHFMPYDAVVNGRRVDVKWTRILSGCLQAKANKEWANRPDYFALMIGRMPAYTFVGYMRASDLLVDSRIDRRRQKTPVYSARQDELYAEMY